MTIKLMLEPSDNYCSEELSEITAVTMKEPKEEQKEATDGLDPIDYDNNNNNGNGDSGEICEGNPFLFLFCLVVSYSFSGNITF